MFRFPWSDMHSLNLGWFLQKFNELREDWATAEAGIDGALDAEIEKAEDALSDVFDARDAAAASATAAAGSASAAETSATAAQNSATAAASSATLANQKATAAGLSEAAAAQSATQAGNSATAAAGSATAAGQSATNAAASETAAGQSASAAAASETAAGNSATAAAASAAAAEAVEESIPADYTALSNDVQNIKDLMTIFPSAAFRPFKQKGSGIFKHRQSTIQNNYLKIEDVQNNTNSFLVIISGNGTPSFSGVADPVFTDEKLISLSVPSSVDVYLIATSKGTLGTTAALRVYTGTSAENMALVHNPAFLNNEFIIQKLSNTVITNGLLAIGLSSGSAIAGNTYEVIFDLIALPKAASLGMSILPNQINGTNEEETEYTRTEEEAEYTGR